MVKRGTAERTEGRKALARSVTKAMEYLSDRNRSLSIEANVTHSMLTRSVIELDDSDERALAEVINLLLKELT